MPKKKITRKRASRKKAAKKAPKKAARRRARQTPVAVGDPVRLPPGIRNEIGRYDPRLARAARAPEAIEGIVASIRNVGTGKFVAKTRGDLGRFVLEILHSHTFRFQFSSERNSPGVGGQDVPSQNPVRQRIQALLREMAGGKELPTGTAGLLSQEPFASLLDGWRVVKVKAESVEHLE